MTISNDQDYREKEATYYLDVIGPLQRTATPRSIKVDFSFTEKILTAYASRPIFPEYSDQKERYINTYSLEEICAEKLRSLIQRTEPRDLYDVWKVITDPPGQVGLPVYC